MHPDGRTTQKRPATGGKPAVDILDLMRLRYTWRVLPMVVSISTVAVSMAR